MSNSVIKVGVSFGTQQIDMDLQSLLFSNANVSTINSEVDILNSTVDINDAIPIVTQSANENSDFVAEGINNFKYLKYVDHR